MYTGDFGLLMAFTTPVDLQPLCENIGRILQTAKDAGRLFVDDEYAFCGVETVKRSDCISIGPVVSEWRDDTKAMFSLRIEFTECFDHCWLTSLVKPIIDAGLFPEDKGVTTFTYTAGGMSQQVSIPGFFADWDFPSDE